MSSFPPPGIPRTRNRLVAFGLGLVILGWVILLADLLVSEAILKAGSLVAVLSLKGDVATLAQMAVLTGLGLALLGGLREGFGALNGFFDAVLHRSTTSRQAPAQDGPPDDDDAEIVTMPPGADRISPERSASMPPSRDRNYVILADGSVEVETLLGTRIFASLDEARDFIR